MFRRRIMLSQSEAQIVYYSKFTIKFKNNSNNNQIYHSSLAVSKVYYGLAFTLKIGHNIPNHFPQIYEPVVVDINVKRKKDGLLIWHSNETAAATAEDPFGKQTFNVVIINTLGNTGDDNILPEAGNPINLEDGLYDVEITLTSKNIIGTLLDGELNKQASVYTYASQESSTSKTPTTYYCKCLYSVEEIEPKDFFTNTMAYFVEGE